MLGDYANPIYRETANAAVPQIDAVATVKKLKDAHINSYAYLIAPDSKANPVVSARQWADLPNFARVAGMFDIDVFVYLVPPSEAPQAAYAPFHWDYAAWAEEIARVARAHTAIKGLMIDDFGGNTHNRSSLSFHFTPDYVNVMMQRARVQASWLTFTPVFYYHDLVGRRAILADYRHVLDGIVFPYFASTDAAIKPGNTRDHSQALEQGLRVAGLLKCRRNTSCTQIVLRAQTAGQQRPESATVRGTFTPVSNQRRTISFWINDDREANKTANYQVQAVVNGRAAKAYAPGHGWTRHTFDVTRETSGSHATKVELRFVKSRERTSDAVVLLIEDIQLSGFQQGKQFPAGILTTLGAKTSTARNVAFIYMTYASSLGTEGGIGASPSYVEQILGAIDDLRRQEFVDGSLIYRLNLTGSEALAADPATYSIVQRAYKKWFSGR